MKHQGLGDTIEAVTKATGIKAIVDAGSKVLNIVKTLIMQKDLRSNGGGFS